MEGALLRLNGRALITLRGSLLGFSAQERVAIAAARMEAILARQQLPEVTFEELPQGTRLRLGGEPAFTITSAEIDQEAGDTTTAVAHALAQRLTDAIAELRREQTLRYRVRALCYVLLGTSLFGAFVALLVRAKAWLTRRLSGAAATAHGQLLHVHDMELLRTSRLLRLSRIFIGALLWLLLMSGAVVWLSFALAQFPPTRPWGDELLGRLLGIVRSGGVALVGALPGLLFVGIIVLVARGVTEVAAVWFDQVEHARIQLEWLQADAVRPTRRIFSVMVWGFALAMAYPYVPGAQTEAFKGLSVLFGVMVSLGGSSVIGRALAGLTLMYSRLFRRGDYVRIGDTEGLVVDVGMFATRIRSGLGEEIAVPSSEVVGAIVKNYSHGAAGAGYLVTTGVTIGYATPWRQVHAMLEEAARRTAGLAATPAPMVRQTGLSDFYVRYRLAVYARAKDPPTRVSVLSELHAHIQDVFNEHGVQIMSPHYEGDPDQPQVVPKENWYAAPAGVAADERSPARSEVTSRSSTGN
ncbi:MAG TPA: mechanosensitive ion channel domain-containing protein [Polyangiaceae bacterium]|jgi:small-conductance mechanosensitive channel|nr:mechanosensitive ion channel domain-containing protein [Polyangiaceae bacterium]